MRYIFGVETFDGNKTTVAVVADNMEKAIGRLYDYHISKGELKYYWFKSTDSGEVDVPYKNPEARKTMCFMVGLAGAYLGTNHLSSENIDRIAINGVKDKITQRLIKEDIKNE